MNLWRAEEGLFIDRVSTRINVIETRLGSVHKLSCVVSGFLTPFSHISAVSSLSFARFWPIFYPLFIPDIIYGRSLIISLSMWEKLGYLSIGKLTFYIRLQLWYLNTFPRVSWHWRDHSCLWIVLYGPSQPENEKKSLKLVRTQVRTST